MRVFFLSLVIFAAAISSCAPARIVKKQRDTTMSVIDPLPTLDDQLKALKRVKESNQRLVVLHENGYLYFDGMLTKRSKIAEQIHQFIINEASSPKQAVIAYRSHINVKYEEYNRVETALKRGFYKARDTYAKQKYKKSYFKLDYKTRKKIRKVIPRNLIEAEPYQF